MQGNFIDLFGQSVQPTKYCKVCEQHLPLKAFYQMRTKDGRTRYRQSWCKECNREKCRQWAKKNYRRRSLKRMFGLTLADYEQMHDEQHGFCAICGEPETKIHPTDKSKTQPLAVDHDHKTGQIRKLLCNRCNAGLGNFRDDPERLQKAIAYLKSFGK